MRNRRGQVTIWVIVAILIVVIIVGYFLITNKISIIKPQSNYLNPEEYIDKCAKDSVGNVTSILLAQGGYISPTNYMTYNNKKVQFLCYTRDYYSACIMQEPLYIQHVEKEIKSYVEPQITACFGKLEEEYTKRNYNFQMLNNEPEITIELKPRDVEISIKNKIVISKENSETRTYENFKTRINEPIYDLFKMGLEIANQEAKYCTFNNLGVMIFYPNYIIETKFVGEGIGSGKLYTIKDKITNKQLNVAIRSCAIPAGF